MRAELTAIVIILGVRVRWGSSDEPKHRRAVGLRGKEQGMDTIDRVQKSPDSQGWTQRLRACRELGSREL